MRAGHGNLRVGVTPARIAIVYPLDAIACVQRLISPVKRTKLLFTGNILSKQVVGVPTGCGSYSLMAERFDGGGHSNVITLLRVLCTRILPIS